jgi:antitoxin PrlF
LEEISTITAKGQATVPRAVRKARGVGRGGRIAFRVDERGVTVHRVETGHDDPALGRFLALLAGDLDARPEAVRALTPELAGRLRGLAEGVPVDPDAPIGGEVDL